MRTVLAVLVLLIATWPTAAAAKPPPSARIDSVVAEHLDATDTPGAALAVLGDGRILHTQVWGEDGNGDPISTDTPFLWGSVTKPITGLAIQQLAEDGKLELDAPVDRYLEWFRPTWRGSPAVPTVAQLLTNTSGMSTDVDSAVADRHDTRPNALGAVARELADVELSAPPGDDYAYVSANFLLLGAIIEEVTGRGFVDRLRDTVFAPLDMSTVIGSVEDSRRLPPGHQQYFGHPVSYQDPYDTSGLSYGNLGGSLDDLARFTLAELNGGELDENRVLSAEGIAESHEGRVETSSGRFGYGWSVDRLDGTGDTMVWKTGAMPGYHTTIVLLPEHDRAVVVLQNAYSEARALQLRNAALDAARLAIGAEPGPALAADQMLSVLPWITAAVTVAFGLFWWCAGRGLNRRPDRRGPRVRVGVWLVAGAAVPGVLLLALPTWLGGSLRQMFLWAPDLAYSIVVLSVMVPSAAGWRVWAAYRSGRRKSGHVGDTDPNGALVESKACP